MPRPFYLAAEQQLIYHEALFDKAKGQWDQAAAAAVLAEELAVDQSMVVQASASHELIGRAEALTEEHVIGRDPNFDAENTKRTEALRTQLAGQSAAFIPCQDRLEPHLLEETDLLYAQAELTIEGWKVADGTSFLDRAEELLATYVPAEAAACAR